MPDNLKDFDTKMFRLGTLCIYEHRYKGLNQSLRYVRTRQCIGCNRMHYKNNKEKLRKRARDKWANDHKYRAEMQAKHQEHYRANRENVLKRTREWDINNRDKVKMAHRKRERKDRKLKNNRAINHTLRRRLREALKRYSITGKIRSSDEYGINYDAIIKHLGQHPNTIGKKGIWHIDHIVPLSAFNMNDPDQVKLAFAPENHRWLLAKKNLQKSKKIPRQIDVFLENQYSVAVKAD